MSSFIALDNNCYLTFIIQRTRPWLSTLQDILNNLTDQTPKPIINKRTYNYITSFATSLESLLLDKHSKKLLTKYARNKSPKTEKELSLFIEAVDGNQFNQIIEACLLILKTPQLHHISTQNALFVRTLIDNNTITFLDHGKKKNNFSNKLFKTDTEDALIIEELYAIKEKQFKKGTLYSEDNDLIKEGKTENTEKTLGITITHIKNLN